MVMPRQLLLPFAVPALLLLLALVGSWQPTAPNRRAPAPQETADNTMGSANRATLTFGDTKSERTSPLRHNASVGDGVTTATNLEGVWCRRLSLGTGECGYLYFSLHESVKAGLRGDGTVEIDCLAAEPCEVWLEFDASGWGRAKRMAYARASEVYHLSGDMGWTKVSFQPRGGTFRNAQNGRSDLRLGVRPPRVCVSQVTVMPGGRTSDGLWH